MELTVEAPDRAESVPPSNRGEVMGQAIGESLPFAVGVAISPIPIIAVILMLLSRRAVQQHRIRARLASRDRRGHC